MLALYSTQPSEALVRQLCAELDLLAAGCQAMEERARSKLAEVSIVSAEDCTAAHLLCITPNPAAACPFPMKAPHGLTQSRSFD